MTNQEAVSVIEEVLELEAGTLAGSETLADLDWDSLRALALLAAVDEQWSIVLRASDLAKCKTVEDLVLAMTKRDATPV